MISVEVVHDKTSAVAKSKRDMEVVVTLHNHSSAALLTWTYLLTYLLT